MERRNCTYRQVTTAPLQGVRWAADPPIYRVSDVMSREWPAHLHFNYDQDEIGRHGMNRRLMEVGGRWSIGFC
jgi:hypothetical protein